MFGLHMFVKDQTGCAVYESHMKIKDGWRSLISEERGLQEIHQWTKTSRSRSESTRRVQIKKKLRTHRTTKTGAMDRHSYDLYIQNIFSKKSKRDLIRIGKGFRILKTDDLLKPKILQITSSSMMMKTRSENSITRLQESERISGFYRIK